MEFMLNCIKGTAIPEVLINCIVPEEIKNTFTEEKINYGYEKAELDLIRDDLNKLIQNGFT